MPDSILLSNENGVATVALNRPEKRNALNVEMLDRLPGILRELGADAAVRCVVITGAGDRAFCGGGDIQGLEQGANGDGEIQGNGVQHLIDRNIAWCEAPLLLHEMPKPTLAVLNGTAAGAGFSLALSCDLRIAAAGVRLTTAFAKVGMSGDFGGSYFLTRLVGTAKARELYYLSEKVAAEDALGLGLVNWVVPREELEAQALELAERLAAGPPIAYRYMKRNLNMAAHTDACTLLAVEAETMIRTAFTDDVRQAALAFFEGRSPEFRGR